MSKRLNQKYKLRGTTATYRMPSRKNDVLDMEELAMTYATNVGNIPERLNFARACEIQHLCSWFLPLYREHLKRQKEKSSLGKGRAE